MDPVHADLLTESVEEALSSVPPGERGAWIEAVARGYESAKRAGEAGPGRRSTGSWYTPDEVVAEVLGDAGLTAAIARRASVADPACGTGHFLVAAGDRMRDRARGGASLAVRLHGMDLDPMAVAIARVRLRARFGGTASAWAQSVRCGDSLAAGAWARTFDAVVGNPPFLGQLSATTARGAAQNDALRDRFDGVVRRYADAASAFLLLGCELAPQGAIAMVLPVSALSAGDSKPVRIECARRRGLRSVRFLPDSAFGAAVRTCVVALGARRRTVRVLGSGGDATLMPVAGLADGAWGASLAAVRGVPRPGIVDASGTLDDWMTATADFRQHYYALEGLVRERRHAASPSTREPALVTVGAIGAASLGWGERAVKIHGRSFAAPVVRVDQLAAHPVLGAWHRARGVPKVLVATQTRVLEAWVDEHARTLPSTPVITVVPRKGADLWRVGAALLAPPVAAEAWWRHAGAGMSTRAIRISASQLRAMPAPGDRRAWDRGARALRDWQRSPDRDAARDRFADAMCDAYGVPGGSERASLVRWWIEGLGNVRTGGGFC